MGRGDGRPAHRTRDRDRVRGWCNRGGPALYVSLPGEQAAEQFLALSIAGARETLYFTNAYFAPDANFIELLIAAARRGVDVRILTAGPRTDVHTVRFAGRAWYDTLLTAGVRLYEWQPSTLHAKTMVVDGLWSTIGSMNFDNRSLALNDEANLLVLDRNVGRRMDVIFFDDLRHSEEITLERFRERSRIERILETAANLITRLLGSIEVCGCEPCEPRPNSFTLRLSAADRITPER